MASSGSRAAKGGAGTLPVTTPKVKIGGAVQARITCTHIEHSVGLTPSRAFLRISGNDLAINGPVTLNRFAWPWKAGTPVEVSVKGAKRFVGCLMRRHDAGQGDTISWEAWDYRWLLNQIPIRGAFVWDNAAGTVKFLPRFEARFNPKGFWNCMYGSRSIPVFAPVADIGKVYQAPDTAYTNKPSSPWMHTPWTPRRVLEYIHFCCSQAAADLIGDKSDFRYLTNTVFQWPKETLSIVGYDGASAGTDPLDRKMPDVSIRGMKALGAIHRVLDVVGSHGIRVHNRGNISSLDFFPKGVSGQFATDYGTGTINLETTGNPITVVDTAFDFTLDEDASNVSESCLVEGGIIHTESSFEYDEYSTIYHLEKAWSTAEERAAITAMVGTKSGREGDEFLYCYLPEKDPPPGDFYTHTLICDGTEVLDAEGNGTGSYRPLALAGTPQAWSLIRTFFPTVFKAYRINTYAIEQDETAKKMFDGGGAAEAERSATAASEVSGASPDTAAAAGAAAAAATDGYKNRTKFPVLQSDGRPILPAQLQFYVNGDERLMQKFPIRVQVADSSNPGTKNYVDVPFNAGVRVTDNGWIWLDGLAEDADKTHYCTYNNSLYDSTCVNITANHIKINAAIPMDHRVKGYSAIKNGESCFDPSIAAAIGGPPMFYIDSPNAYHEDHQVNSSPTALKFAVSKDNQEGDLEVPITRILPPTSEANSAADAAKRRLLGTRYPTRRSAWYMVGIRPDYNVGDWISKVDAHGEYDLNAPIENIVDDFASQTTILGGLVGFTSAAKAGKDSKNPFMAKVGDTVANTAKGVLAAATKSPSGPKPPPSPSGSAPSEAPSKDPVERAKPKVGEWKMEVEDDE